MHDEGFQTVFHIFYLDNQAPIFTSCSDKVFFNDPLEHTAEIDWSRISALDNDGVTPNITCDPPEGTVLGTGYYPATCNATDNSGNQRKCDFQIEIKG